MTSNPLNIAILGATSHIAKGLVYHFLHHTNHRLHLFSRSSRAVQTFLQTFAPHGRQGSVLYEGYDHFMTGTYDVLINCVGVGTQKKLQGQFSRYFTVIEDFDNLCLSYLRSRDPDALYISLSSGAIYGRCHRKAVSKKSFVVLAVNNIRPEDYYGIARLYTEAKHRSLDQFNIVDLRIFSYFSRFADLDEEYFVTEMIRCIVRGLVFRTTPQDMVRDYIHPTDLFDLVCCCIDVRKLNRAFDAISLQPVSKMQLIDLFSTEMNLRCEITKDSIPKVATGNKEVYCSTNYSAQEIGHRPSFTSLEAVRAETRELLKTLENVHGISWTSCGG
ncbi:NAD-dependent epimerase/dehydratase family protein [Desulfosoma sp.]